MKIQGYPLICSGIHYTGYHLKAMCKECPLYSRKKQGYDLRYDAKHNFNTAIAAIRRLKQDVDKTQFSTQENFGNDSDCLLAFIKLLIDRCGDDDKKMFAFYNYIKSYPSQLGLELSDEKSVFAHIFN